MPCFIMKSTASGAFSFAHSKDLITACLWNQSPCPALVFEQSTDGTTN